MTTKEFQERYHDYITESETEATIEAMKLKVVDENGKTEVVHPIKIGDKWCLMLNTAAKFLEEVGLI